MTCNNARRAGDIRHGGGNIGIVSRNKANVAGDIRYVCDRIDNAGDRIDNAGDRIANVPVQQRPVILATPPAAFVRSLQADYYAAIAF